jgi:RNA polymerase sigma-70 factor (ECF subfamily)
MERLFREHNEALIRFLHARLRSYQEAREVAQEAYVRLLSLDNPGAISYLRAFLFKTAANLAIDRRRRDQTQGRVMEPPGYEELADELTPERHLASQQQLKRLERLVVALPPKCREAFVLHQVHGKDFSSIAETLGLSESMVRKYVVRALLYCRAGLRWGEGSNET